jgi:pimeloyl-ACP methyl ester carboxylesterase
MWDLFGAKEKKLQEERQRQEQLIKEQLKALECNLEHELQKEKITQKGLIAKKKLEQKQKRAFEEEQKKKEKQHRNTGGSNTPPPPPPPPSEEEASREEASEKKVVRSNIEIAREGYQQLVHAIIRPPRATYNMEDLGPSDFTFCGKSFRRTDLTLITERGYHLECSHWQPSSSSSPLLHQHQQQQADTDTDTDTDQDQMITIPVVVYMHGNSSARVEVLPQLSFLLSLGVSVFAFDFTGSGKSDGDYVSLGYYEREDLTCVVAHLRSSSTSSSSKNAGNIALWGRSMGAATALMYGDRDPTIACMIVDSSFADLVQLAEEMVEKGREQGIIVPTVVISVALQMIQWSVQKQANFNIKDISPVAHAEHCSIPALFVAGDHDDFIKKHHAEQLCEKYAGHKNLLVVPGDHNDPRPQVMFDSAANFLKRYLEIPERWALPVPPSMNLMRPPWNHGRLHFQAHHPTRQRAPVVNPKDSVSTKPTITPAKEDTGFDGDKMGMTKERQKEVQSSLFKMLGHENDQNDQ